MVRSILANEATVVHQKVKPITCGEYVAAWTKFLEQCSKNIKECATNEVNQTEGVCWQGQSVTMWNKDRTSSVLGRARDWNYRAKMGGMTRHTHKWSQSKAHTNHPNCKDKGQPKVKHTGKNAQKTKKNETYCEQRWIAEIQRFEDGKRSKGLRCQTAELVAGKIQLL